MLKVDPVKEFIRPLADLVFFFFYSTGCLATLLTRKKILVGETVWSPMTITIRLHSTRNPHRVTWQIHRTRYTQSDLTGTYIHAYIHDGSLFVRWAWPSLIKKHWLNPEFDINRWVDGYFEASKRLPFFAGYNDILFFSGFFDIHTYLHT